LFKTMFYIKNVPVWERLIRASIGLGLIVYVLLGNPSMFLSILSLASAAFVIVTGFFGWCPMCALVGRKIKAESVGK
jgi:hypothetical protein